MHGFLWTDGVTRRDDSLWAAGSLGALLAVCGVGLLAGIASAHVRLHLGLPGHKAVLWMTPVIAARLLFRSRVGATGGTLAATFASMASGGPLGAAAAGLPIAGLAGALLDLGIDFVERHRFGAGWSILLVGLAGAGANVAMLGRRLLWPLFESHVLVGTGGIGGRLVSYAVFGLLAGLLGAALARVLARRKTLSE